MPWLSTLHPFGDTSSLTRLIIGLDEALRDYRGSEEAPLLRSPGPSQDPWNEDLFYRHLPVPPRVLDREKGDPVESGSPGAMLPDPHQDPLQDERGAPVHSGDEPGVVLSSTAAPIAEGFKALAGLLAALLLLPWQGRRPYTHPKRERGIRGTPLARASGESVEACRRRHAMVESEPKR
jgi:hypothetical protein